MQDSSSLPLPYVVIDGRYDIQHRSPAFADTFPPADNFLSLVDAESQTKVFSFIRPGLRRQVLEANLHTVEDPLVLCQLHVLWTGDNQATVICLPQQAQVRQLSEELDRLRLILQTSDIAGLASVQKLDEPAAGDASAGSGDRLAPILPKTSVLLTEMLANIVADVEEEALLCGAVIDLFLPTAAVPAVCADPALVRYILEEVLQHAVQAVCANRWVSKGHIQVRLEEGLDSLRLTVGDNGTGSDMESQGKNQVARDLNTQQTSWKGLNLTACQTMMKTQGGTMDIQPLQGQGTLVCLTFPKTQMSNMG